MTATCKSCGAPEGQRVFRHSGGKKWTQEFDVVSMDPEYSAHATIINLDRSGLCNKCRYHQGE